MILGTVKIFCFRGLVIFKIRLFSKWAFFLHISSNMLLVLTLPALIKESFTKFDVIEYHIFAIRLEAYVPFKFHTGGTITMVEPWRGAGLKKLGAIYWRG